LEAAVTEETAKLPVQLPPCPEGFICDRIGGGSDDRPPLPRNAKFVASMEFSLSFAESYSERFYVRFSRKHSRWELWSDGHSDEGPCREVYAIGPAMKIPPKVAAIHLLAAAWKDTYDSEPWYVVLKPGLVSEDEVDAIFAMLFPDLTGATTAEPEETETPTTEPEMPETPTTEETSP
jgi:hypothetical protein